MAAVLTAEDLQDELAIQVARIVAAANRRAAELGVDLKQSWISITEATVDNPHWRINYGPKDYINRRGGDVIIDVDPNDVSVKRVLRGQ
jgi:hypothetical protein